MYFKYLKKYTTSVHLQLVKNSFWGLGSTIFQTLFLSIFFVIISRYYSTIEFANYLIAATIYQLMVGISSMGLGTWFIREFDEERDKVGLIKRFIKIQICLGILFYITNILLVYTLYGEDDIRILGVILGINIIFDNVVYALRSLNIAEAKQKKTAIIMALDALLKLLAVSTFLIVPISVPMLCLLLVIIRLLTVNFFIKSSFDKNIGIKELWFHKVTFEDVQKQVMLNWRFIIIVGVSIVYWRSATIIISKFIGAYELANYEIAFKIMSVFIMIPMIASTTLYPHFVKLYNNNDYQAIRKFYNLVFFSFTIFSLISYTFIQSFSGPIISFVFGDKYSLSTLCLNEMFLTFLVLPTVLLQANLIVAMKREKLDMFFNLIALSIYIIACFIGLYFSKSLSIINYSIFTSFFIFHIMQSIFLTRLKITFPRHSFIFYCVILLFVGYYNFMTLNIDPIALFLSVTLLGISALSFYLMKILKAKILLKQNQHFTL